ncbi:thioesterase-like superfamily-domain-containing protein [Xylaria arbuscula]|nr:thioesterase-like superfamily-domain-containing protein [Xylaria arbuscula]
MPPRTPLSATLRPSSVIPAVHLRASLVVQSPFVTKANFSATTTTREKSSAPPLPPTRWVSDVRARIGKCISFGCNPAQVQRAASIVETLAREWRILSAGSEGFLAGGRAGLENQQVVWGEMDSFGHVNNANYIRYAESARVNWILHFAVQDPKHKEAWRDLMQPKRIGLIMKSITAEYKFPMTTPDTISAYHRLRTCPEETHTSLILDCIILSHRHRRIAARTFEDVAIYDYREAKKTVLPDFMLDVLRDTWRKQEERTTWARERIWGLLKEVEALEKETWDREDAVEDFGGAQK